MFNDFKEGKQSWGITAHRRAMETELSIEALDTTRQMGSWRSWWVQDGGKDPEGMVLTETLKKDVGSADNIGP